MLHRVFSSISMLMGALLFLTGILSAGGGDTASMVFMSLVGAMLFYAGFRKVNPWAKAVEEQVPSSVDEQAAEILAEQIKNQDTEFNLAMAGVSDNKNVNVTVAYALKSAADDILHRKVFTAAEEKQILQMLQRAKINKDEADQYGGLTLLKKAALIRHVIQDATPVNIPEGEFMQRFNFLKSERLVWVFDQAHYFVLPIPDDEKDVSEDQKEKIFDGVYVPPAAFKDLAFPMGGGLDYQGPGTLALTTRHLYFGSRDDIIKLNLTKVAHLIPYSEGLGFKKNTRDGRALLFKLEDPWLAYNIAENLRSKAIKRQEAL